MTDISKVLELEKNYPDVNAMDKAKEQWDSVAKPLNSLGKFEKAVIQLAGIYGEHNFEIKNKAVLTYCSDNGVVEEGISQSDSSVTATVALSMAAGKANINVMAGKAGAEVYPVDIGIKESVSHENLINKKVAKGTKNIAHEAAMTDKQCLKAIKTGIELVGELKEKNTDIIAIGEMGIGNTTTSSAMSSVLLNRSVRELTGRGAGLSGEALDRKIKTIIQAIKVNKPDSNDAFDILKKLGGFDIAAMAGTCIGGMVYGVPIVVDGVISAVAALTAVRMVPECSPYILASHSSKEPAQELLLKDMGKSAIIYADMCLGEGTGAVLLFPLLDIALAEYSTAHRFKEIDMEPYKPL
jgi:nicotinate-nucleotide--dimethylbenzimidazole phosphoribosyltransferase